ncbi:MAG: transcriptional regulator [Desulfobulbus propionicus]|nr:MAG: transcriptional regulator [Desulfobulbus propionicus]
MKRENFSRGRIQLGKTQKELARLLGVSQKAVQSYEQGWRNVPLHVERQLYFLLVNQRLAGGSRRRDCWTVKKCQVKKQCPVWEFKSGHLCWFLSGTLCEAAPGKTWKNKIEACRSCNVLTDFL